MKPSKYMFRKMAHHHLSMHFKEECMKCKDTMFLEIDHIKPSSKYPELEYALDNVQFLCRSCNASKGNRHEMGYEPEPIIEEPFDKCGFFTALLASLDKKENESGTK